MLINTYVYKGPHNSLLAPCVIGALKVPKEDHEDLIPSTTRLYDRRKSLKKFNSLISKLDLHIACVDAAEINSFGDSAINKKLDRITLKYHAQAIDLQDVCYIKQVKKPRLWHERLLVILTVYYRNVFLDSLSDCNTSLVDLDVDYYKHIEVLKTYKHLPLIYHWEQTMAAFKSIEPKPPWYQREMQTIEKLNRGI